MEMRPALFLDRDGVLNKDRGYVARVADLEWVEGAMETVAAFKARGWFVFVITNQTGIAHGLYTEADMQAVLFGTPAAPVTQGRGWTGWSRSSRRRKNCSKSASMRTPMPVLPARAVRPRRWMYWALVSGSPTWQTMVTSG